MHPGERLRFYIAFLVGVLFAPYFYVRKFYRTRRFSGKTRRILVVPIITRVGDLVCATPVFRALKLAYPEAELSVVVSKWNKGIVENNPRIDRFINISDERYKGYVGRVRFLFDIGRADYDWVISLTNNPFNNLIALYSSAPQRIKMRSEERTVWERLTDWVNTRTVLYKNHTFLPRFYLTLLAPLGIKNTEVKKEVFATDAARSKIAEFLSSRGVDEKRMLIGFSITAGNKIKEWGDEKFAMLISRIRAKWPDAKCVVLGSGADRTRIDTLIDGLGDASVFSATEFSLAELPALVERLSLFVAVDTGTVYVAHALGVPLVDIIGPVDPAEQPPSDEKSIQVLPGPGIAPTSFTIKRPGPAELHKRSLDATTVDMVFSAVEKLIRS